MNARNLFDLSEKVIILTGAAGNLGSQYAEGLSEMGANVVLADLDYPRCKEIGKQLKLTNDVDPEPIKLDLTNKSSIKNLVSKTMKKYSKIDVLINNAAYQGNDKIRKTPFEELSLKDWNDAIAVNLTGIFLMSQEVGKVMKKQKRGNIINISSHME